MLYTNTSIFYRITTATGSNVPVESLQVELWVDITTQLPVLFEVKIENRDGIMTKNILFKDSIFVKKATVPLC